ncbi:hypothetical protein [Amycolatopsis ultiminotia]
MKSIALPVIAAVAGLTFSTPVASASDQAVPRRPNPAAPSCGGTFSVFYLGSKPVNDVFSVRIYYSDMYRWTQGQGGTIDYTASSGQSFDGYNANPSGGSSVIDNVPSTFVGTWHAYVYRIDGTNACIAEFDVAHDTPPKSH